MNIIDYVKWRGDILFDERPVNPIDALIFAQLSYVKLLNIVPSNFKNSISISSAYEKFVGSEDYAERMNLGAMLNPLTIDLFELCSKSPRFMNVELKGFCEILNLSKEEQFCAVTFSYKNKWNFISFRGTDDNIVGWKEDFNLGYLDTVPAQSDSLSYLESAALNLKGIIFVGGHSKGGNLSLFASTKCDQKIQKRIEAVYNFDGPGFKNSFYDGLDFKLIHKRLKFFVPQMSIVGMLFSHKEYVTVLSNEKHIMQHDPFSWQVEGTYFETLEDITEESHFLERTINQWFKEMSEEKCRLFVDTLFSILRESRFQTNYELSENKIEATKNIARYLHQIDHETAQKVAGILKDLFKIGIKNLL